MSKLPFISDLNLDKAINHVTSALGNLQNDKNAIIQSFENDDIFGSKLFSNSIDPFAMKFGMSLYGEDKWLEAEISRQLYKTFEQKIGEFHQLILGSVEGWVDLGIGDKTQIDLRNEDSTIFIELKNKHNTCNGDSLKKVQEKLISVLEDYPEAKGYWAYIVPGEKQKFGCDFWRSGQGKAAPKRHDRLYKVWGSEVYKLVTGDRENLSRLYEYLETENLNIPDGTQNLRDVSSEIMEIALPRLELIKSQIFEKMLVG